MATPVILRMNVHCDVCARKIRRTSSNVDGVEGVWASPETGVVVVTGSPDAAALRSRIEYVTRRLVTVVSDGGAEEAPDNRWRAPPPDDWWTTTYSASSRSRFDSSLEAPDHWLMAQSRYAVPSPPQGYPPYVGMERCRLTTPRIRSRRTRTTAAGAATTGLYLGSKASSANSCHVR